MGRILKKTLAVILIGLGIGILLVLLLLKKTLAVILIGLGIGILLVLLLPLSGWLFIISVAIIIMGISWLCN